jgi:ABC-type nickel/cobalt efflux system permease component RcnA
LNELHVSSLSMTGCRRNGRLQEGIRIAGLLFALAAGGPRTACGHAFGAIGVDYYTVVTPVAQGVEIDVETHFAELPTVSIKLRHDTNGDGRLDRSEILAYIRQVESAYVQRVEAYATHAGRRFDLVPELPGDDLEARASGRMVRGDNDGETLRIRWRLLARWPAHLVTAPGEPVRVFVRIRIAREYASSIMVTGLADAPIRVLASNLASEKDTPRPPDITPPVAKSEEAPFVTEASLVCVSGEYAGPVLKEDDGGTILAAGEESDGDDAYRFLASDSANGGVRKLDQFQDTIRVNVRRLFEPPVSASARIWIVALCFLWGAVHALTPGHGKTIVSATLVGVRGRYIHAVVMGLTITLTHTVLVLILALAAYWMQDRFTYPPWLQPLSAVAILLVGANQIRVGCGRLFHSHNASGASAPDDHRHGWRFWRHTHSHASPVRTLSSWRDVVTIGVTGGLVPCPAAIVLVLLLWRIPLLSLLSLLCFSAGLALALIAVGVAAVAGTRFATRMLESRRGTGRVSPASVLPIVGGIVLLVYGWLLLPGMH